MACIQPHAAAKTICMNKEPTGMVNGLTNDGDGRLADPAGDCARGRSKRTSMCSVRQQIERDVHGPRAEMAGDPSGNWDVRFLND
jgi:hypothetical protein